MRTEEVNFELLNALSNYMNEMSALNNRDWPCFLLTQEIPLISDYGTWCMQMDEMMSVIYEYVGKKYSIIGCIDKESTQEGAHLITFQFKIDTSLKKALQEKPWYFKLQEHDIEELENISDGAVIEKILKFDVLHMISAMNHEKEQIINMFSLTSRLLLATILDLSTYETVERLLMVNGFKESY